MTRRSLLTLTALPLLRASDPFEERWRAVADRVIAGRPDAVGFAAADERLMLGLMRLYERTKYPLYVDFVEAWARVHVVSGLAQRSAPSLAILLLNEARPKAEFERYVTGALEGAEDLESASFLARYGMVRRKPGLVLRAARSLPLQTPVSAEMLLTMADVLEALEPMQPEYEPLARCGQTVRPVAEDLLSLAAAWKLVRIQVAPAARRGEALEQWKKVHATGEPGAVGDYLMAAAEAAGAL